MMCRYYDFVYTPFQFETRFILYNKIVIRELSGSGLHLIYGPGLSLLFTRTNTDVGLLCFQLLKVKPKCILYCILRWILNVTIEIKRLIFFLNINLINQLYLKWDILEFFSFETFGTDQIDVLEFLNKIRKLVYLVSFLNPTRY